MDGNGALFGVLSGNTREVLHKFTVDLPKKHGGRFSFKPGGNCSILWQTSQEGDPVDVCFVVESKT